MRRELKNGQKKCMEFMAIICGRVCECVCNSVQNIYKNLLTENCCENQSASLFLYQGSVWIFLNIFHIDLC